MGRCKNSPCDKCVHLISVMGKKEMCCELTNKYSKECFTTQYEKYMQDTKAINVDQWITLYVNGRKERALIKEVRYIEQDVDADWIKDLDLRAYYIKSHNKRSVMYDIEINGESILYSFSANAAGKCFLEGKRDNDWYGETIKIEITKYDYLLDLLWKASEHTDYGLISNFAPSRGY